MARKGDDYSLHVACGRCGKEETFHAYADIEGEELFTDADRDGGRLPIYLTPGWSTTMPGGDICSGCTSTADRRYEDGACMRCGKEELEEISEGFIAEDPFDLDGELLVCGDCYTDEDRRWGIAQLHGGEADGSPS